MKNFCSVENLSPNKLYEPIEVGEDYFTGDFLFLDLEYPGFQVSPEPSFKDREFSLNEEPFSISDKVEMISHFSSIFTPDIF